MNAETSIEILKYGFTIITLLGIAAGTWFIVRGASERMRTRLTRDISERRAAMDALAEAHGRAADGPTRDALARNYRFHQAAVRSLDPSAITGDLPLR